MAKANAGKVQLDSVGRRTLGWYAPRLAGTHPAGATLVSPSPWNDLKGCCERTCRSVGIYSGVRSRSSYHCAVPIIFKAEISGIEFATGSWIFDGMTNKGRQISTAVAPPWTFLLIPDDPETFDPSRIYQGGWQRFRKQCSETKREYTFIFNPDTYSPMPYYGIDVTIGLHDENIVALVTTWQETNYQQVPYSCEIFSSTQSVTQSELWNGLTLSNQLTVDFQSPVIASGGTITLTPCVLVEDTNLCVSLPNSSSSAGSSSSSGSASSELSSSDGNSSSAGSSPASSSEPAPESSSASSGEPSSSMASSSDQSSAGGGSGSGGSEGGGSGGGSGSGSGSSSSSSAPPPTCVKCAECCFDTEATADVTFQITDIGGFKHTLTAHGLPRAIEAGRCFAFDGSGCGKIAYTSEDPNDPTTCADYELIVGMTANGAWKITVLSALGWAADSYGWNDFPGDCDGVDNQTVTGNGPFLQPVNVTATITVQGNRCCTDSTGNCTGDCNEEGP